MLRKIYDWVMRLSAHHNAQAILALVAFSESSFFPLPPDAILVPMTLARRQRAWRYALISTIASVIGGMAGYAIGYLLFDSVGQAIISFYGIGAKFDSFRQAYNEYGMAIVFIAGLTPLPYKVFTIASGVTGLSFPLFVAGSVISRGLRFFLVCGLVYWFGPPVKVFIERYLGWVTLALAVLLVGGFFALRYLM